MSLALEEALEGKSPVKSIAQKYGVRYPTLLKYCKLAREGKLPRTPSGEVCFLKRGPKFKYFDHNDRKALELFILTLDQCSLPPSKDALMQRMCELYQQRKGSEAETDLPSYQTLLRNINSLKSARPITVRTTMVDVCWPHLGMS